MAVKVAHERPFPSHFTRLGDCSKLGFCGLAALLMLFGGERLQTAVAEGETRTISFHHIHTNEDLTITYKVNGRYDESALAKIDHVLRDWREDKSVRMDPHVIDLLWEVHREVGAKEPIWVVCGYRSPSTNSMLRSRSSGVAKFSQHMNGKAVDFYIPGVPLDKLRAAGLRAQRGGVGFYPSSGAPFVHMDTGNVRHWPRMPEAQLAAVLAKGQLSSQLASDPRGTVIARGEIQRSERKPAVLAKLGARSAAEDEEPDEAAPAKGAPKLAAKNGPRTKGTDATRMAKAESNAEDALEKQAEKPAPAARPNEARDARIAMGAATAPSKSSGTASYQLASATMIAAPQAHSGMSAELGAAAAKPVAAPGIEMASTSSKPVRLAQASPVGDAAPTAHDVISQRGYWQGLPSADPVEVPPSQSRVGTSPSATPRRPVATANVGATGVARWPLVGQSDPMPNALSYASQPTPIATARALPMGSGAPRVASAVQGDTTVVAKRGDERMLGAIPAGDESPTVTQPKKPGGPVRIGDRFNDPWMRAMIVSPSAQSFLKTTLFGLPDFRNLGPYLQKPPAALAMRFTDDPQTGLPTDRFAGSAVTFISSVKFTIARATVAR